MDFFSQMWTNLTSAGVQGFLQVLTDFFIIFFFIYFLLYFLRNTKSLYIIFGIIIAYLLSLILLPKLSLPVVNKLMSDLSTFFGIAIIIIFQPEIRRALAQTGSIFSRNDTDSKTIDVVVNAAIQMSSTKTGAIIVFEKKIGLAGIVNTSTVLDAKVNSLLLQSIFFKNSPLHDCAVIISKNKIVAAHAVLPLSPEYSDNPVKRLGTRHRAALGITEETDAVALVVSEETGIISVACRGRIVRGYNSAELKKQLEELLIGKNVASDGDASYEHNLANKPDHEDLFEVSKKMDEGDKK